MDNMSPKQKLAAARLWAANQMPYFQAAIWTMEPKFTEYGKLGTVAITPNGVLIVDPQALEQWSVKETAAALVHEVGHLLRDHDQRRQAVMGHPKLWNVAADLEINDDIAKTDLQLPEGGAYPEGFQLPDGLTAEVYYQRLLEQMQDELDDGGEEQGAEASNDQGSGQGDGSEGDEDGDGGGADGSESGDHQGSGGGQGDPREQQGAQKPQAGGGWCGSGGGKPIPGEPEQSQGTTGRTQAELNSVRRQVAEAIQRETEKNRGTVPAGWQRWADEQLKPPRINWRTKLARASRRAIAYRPGAIDYRYDRPSRRQGALGYGMGRPVLPAMRRPVPQVGIGLDTSGSMGPEETQIAVEECVGVLNEVGAQVDFIACDAAVHEVTKVRSYRDLVQSLKGGGGTHFDPVFEAMERLKPRPEVFIFITDGMGPISRPAPTGTHVIWLLVGQDAVEPDHCGHPSWGERVFMDDEGEREPRP